MFPIFQPMFNDDFVGTVIIVEVFLIFMHCTNTDNLRKQTQSDLFLHPLCRDSLRNIRFQQKCPKLLAPFCIENDNNTFHPQPSQFVFKIFVAVVIFFLTFLCFVEGRLILFVYFFLGGGFRIHGSSFCTLWTCIHLSTFLSFDCKIIQ